MPWEYHLRQLAYYLCGSTPEICNNSLSIHGQLSVGMVLSTEMEDAFPLENIFGQLVELVDHPGDSSPQPSHS